MSRKDFEPESLSLTLTQLISRIEFKKSGYLAFTASFLLTLVAVVLSRLVN